MGEAEAAGEGWQSRLRGESGPSSRARPAGGQQEGTGALWGQGGKWGAFLPQPGQTGFTNEMFQASTMHHAPSTFHVLGTVPGAGGVALAEADPVLPWTCDG